MSTGKFWKTGDPFVWLSGSALAFCLLMIGGLVAIILYNGLGIFWPQDLVELRLEDGTRAMGQMVGRQKVPSDSGREGHRVQLKVGNRDVYGLDFRWIDESDIEGEPERPRDAVVFERQEWGNLFAYVTGVYRGAEQVAGPGDAAWTALHEFQGQVRDMADHIHELEREEIGELNYELEALRLEKRRLEMESRPGSELARLEIQRQRYWRQYEELAAELTLRREESQVFEVAVKLSSGEERRVRVADIVLMYRPNRMSTSAKIGLYLSRSWEFVAGQPRESNTEGGIFPALFGTVLMVVLMSLAVVPFGVLAALYLREYARQGVLVRAIRIAVNNLAGVPSIVFGMFGLGFFVYGVGGTIDALFFPESLPTPTYGTGGILWASLTLALLTVPVVVVATEEALVAVPREVREGSLALGSTKFQMVWNVVLPSALPGILTGVILATARGAGEVAPLMITGVVKLAPDLPLDWYWPFFHLERKFMHLGFHIYDVGFQSPNVEAARPMVYTTALLLLAIVLVLNLTAILVRNRLRKRYSSAAF